MSGLPREHIRYQGAKFTEAERVEFVAWLCEPGLDPSNVPLGDSVVLVWPGDRWMLHTTEFICDDKGNRLIDYTTMTMARRPVATPLPNGTGLPLVAA